MYELEEKSLSWERTQSICVTPGAEGVPVYGVRVRLTDGSAWEFPDVDTSPQTVDRLLERLRQAAPEPCHFAELVEDFIAETVTVSL